MKRNLKRPFVVQPQDESVKLIPLTRGQVTIVDASDYVWLTQWNWYAHLDTSTGSFYAARRTFVAGKKERIFLHRELLGLGFDKSYEGDHKDGNTLNNRRFNLRRATRTENRRNSGIQKNNRSGVKGVIWHKSSQRWVARIGVDGRKIYLGSFRTISSAMLAYRAAVVQYHGDFAKAA
jgi:hypothetical protein